MEDKTENEEQCWKNGRRRGTAQENAEKKDRIKGADTERKRNQKGHKETEKERKDTVNIHRRTQGERSHHILLQNPGRLCAWCVSFNEMCSCFQLHSLYSSD